MSGRLEPRSVDLANGAHIEYLETGSSDGTPVVYFHGAGGVFRNAAFMPALGERFRTLAPSRPGYDGSTGVTASARDEATVMGELEAERARSRQLLLNVLPERIVARLEQGERPIADRHDEVAVLFSDFAGFTAIATDLDPKALPAGLTRLELFDKLNGHVKGSTGIIGLFKKPL